MPESESRSIGFGGGQRLSLAAYVTKRGPTDGALAAGGLIAFSGWLAWQPQHGCFTTYLAGTPAVAAKEEQAEQSGRLLNLMRDLGGADQEHVVAGQWWRLLRQRGSCT